MRAIGYFFKKIKCKTAKHYKEEDNQMVFTIISELFLLPIKAIVQQCTEIDINVI